MYSHGGHKQRRNLQGDVSDSNLYLNTVTQSGGVWQQVSFLCPLQVHFTNFIINVNYQTKFLL